jgi:hypothetical protein
MILKSRRQFEFFLADKRPYKGLFPDFSGLLPRNVSNPLFAYLYQFITVFSMGQLAIINAPSSFTFIWSIIKPWLAKETADKVDILGSNYREVLLELVDEDALPSVIGGGCHCGGEGDDGRGCALSGAGPWLEGRVGWGPNTKKVQQDSIESRDDKVEKDKSALEASEDKESRATTAITHEKSLEVNGTAEPTPNINSLAAVP